MAPKQNQAQLNYRLDSSISMDVATCSHFASVDIEKGEHCCAGTQLNVKLDRNKSENKGHSGIEEVCSMSTLP